MIERQDAIRAPHPLAAPFDDGNANFESRVSHLLSGFVGNSGQSDFGEILAFDHRLDAINIALVDRVSRTVATLNVREPIGIKISNNISLELTADILVPIRHYSAPFRNNCPLVLRVANTPLNSGSLCINSRA